MITGLWIFCGVLFLVCCLQMGALVAAFRREQTLSAQVQALRQTIASWEGAYEGDLNVACGMAFDWGMQWEAERSVSRTLLQRGLRRVSYLAGRLAAHAER